MRRRAGGTAVAGQVHEPFRKSGSAPPQPRLGAPGQLPPPAQGQPAYAATPPQPPYPAQPPPPGYLPPQQQIYLPTQQQVYAPPQQQAYAPPQQPPPQYAQPAPALAHAQPARQKHGAAPPPAPVADVLAGPPQPQPRAAAAAAAAAEPRFPPGPATPEMEALRANSQIMSRNLDAMAALLAAVRAN